MALLWDHPTRQLYRLRCTRFSPASPKVLIHMSKAWFRHQAHSSRHVRSIRVGVDYCAFIRARHLIPVRPASVHLQDFMRMIKGYFNVLPQSISSFGSLKSLKRNLIIVSSDPLDVPTDIRPPETMVSLTTPEGQNEMLSWSAASPRLLYPQFGVVRRSGASVSGYCRVLENCRRSAPLPHSALLGLTAATMMSLTYRSTPTSDNRNWQSS
ncbi:hypothetical protein B0H11DRAFT_1972646 [Mycena galericulata]|nr:hypothetical protein B0H11DRAFT_1972646 [Mycena galericulata]